MNSDPNSLSEFNPAGHHQAFATACITSFKLCDPFGVVSIYDDQVMVS